MKLGNSFLVIPGTPNVVPWLGSGFFSAGLVAECLMVVGLLVGEKESGVVSTIRRMSLVEAAHWLAWITALALLNAPAALVAALAAGLGCPCAPLMGR
mmetsp:Transcript_39670/g.88795  ORF Transcript_39670/g.88795 Transcript_39670/m.88795 type:complete len:98 (-) Transcript_39670:1154-1447(-)